MEKRRKLATLALAALMAASLAGAGPAWAQVDNPGGGDPGHGGNPNPGGGTGGNPPPPLPPPGGGSGGGGQSFQSQNSSQGVSSSESVVTSTGDFGGFAFPYFYGSFFPF